MEHARRQLDPVLPLHTPPSTHIFQRQSMEQLKKTQVFRGRKKHIKKKTRKQNIHGIVPGFWVEFCLCVFFLPHKEWPEKNT